MEKKYIVELYDENVKSVGGYDWLQLLISVADKSVMVETAIQLLPYTESDIEKNVREEAYEQGYQDAVVKIGSDEQAIAEKAYQSGLNDAWEAARKICLNESDGGLSGITVHDIFNTEHYRDALRDYTPAKAIEKIRQYEQKEQESVTAEDVMRQYLDTFCKGRSCTGCPLFTPDFTCGRGKHFLHDCVSNEEVRRAYATVIAKMKGES